MDAFFVKMAYTKSLDSARRINRECKSFPFREYMKTEECKKAEFRSYMERMKFLTNTGY